MGRICRDLMPSSLLESLVACPTNQPPRT